MWSEFKKFAFKGNVMDMAVGVMIGAAFNGIVSSIVNDVFMPLFGLIFDTTDLSTKFIVLKGVEGVDLAGMTAAFAARCHDETSAAVLSVYLHAAAGDLAAKKYGEASMTPTDMLDCIGNALSDLIG